MTTPLSEEDILLAAEYVLGLLDADAQLRAERMIADDGRFAEEVAAWQQRMVPVFTAEAAPVPESVWTGVSAALASQSQGLAAKPANNLRRALTVTAVAVAAGVALLLSPSREPVERARSAPMMVAALASPEGRGAMTIAFDPHRAELLITPVAISAAGRYPELWLIDAGGAVQSLGFVDANRVTRLSVAPALRDRIRHGTALAVTLEADRSAPHAQAKGPLLVKGTITAI